MSNPFTRFDLWIQRQHQRVVNLTGVEPTRLSLWCANFVTLVALAVAAFIFNDAESSGARKFWIALSTTVIVFGLQQESMRRFLSHDLIMRMIPVINTTFEIFKFIVLAVAIEGEPFVMLFYGLILLFELSLVGTLYFMICLPPPPPEPKGKLALNT